jgi:uncharacterized membrane protein
MHDPHDPHDPHLALEIRISKMLRYGVILSGIFMLLGWATQIQFSGNPFVAFHEYHPVAFVASIQQMYLGAQWGSLLSYLGLLILIGLPTLRVLMTAVLFVRQRDFVLAAVAAFVLVILLTSFSLGLEI